ncbi:E3 ubiquitin-protein ligase CIP8 [Mangifera indica]|uniref:E3 ubiquitin-protein ligase CIP8 n=1 Tax=Mangifera indica TaxID=29780 RepID=UPI001CFC1A6A|nr:E3 ubiquitin-protein ligase CIP8 [Mangifera indica]
MAQVSSSYLHLQHDLDDETPTLDSLPYRSHPDFDIYTSDSESLPSYSRSQSDVRFHDDASESDSLIANTSDLFDHRENQVNFVMDLFQQRVEQSQVIGGGGGGDGGDDDDIGSGLVSDPLNGSGFGVIGENIDIGIEHLDVDFSLGLGFGVLNIRESNEDNSRNCNNVNLNVFDCNEDDFSVEGRVSGEAGSSDIRVIGFSSDSESEDGNQCDTALGDLVWHSEVEYLSEDHLDDDTSVRLCRDPNRETNEDFEWEEVDGRVDERDIISSIFIDENDDESSISLSISPIIAPEDVVSVERVGGTGNLEWEVLFANNLETNPEMDNNNELYFGDHDDFFHTAEYEMFLGQFAENENAWMGRPPASKAVIQNLPLVILTEEDVENKNAVCAVCKDDISVGEKAKQLPCTHRYHGDCITPWLGIRNTCPVCRYELPTDDPGYERRRTQRASRGQ